MLLSYNLLKKLVDLPEEVPAAEVARRLTLATVEVEQIIDKAKELDNIFVGRVVRLDKHAGADKLKLAFADLGEDIKKKRASENKDELVKIVCGGVNLKEGMTTVVALPGAFVRWHGQGDLIKLTKATIRGEESEGMICAANEIGLAAFFPSGEMEIIDLLKFTEFGDHKLGEPIVNALGLDNIILEIDNKSLTNRPDLWSHLGVAREIAAIFNGRLKDIETDKEIIIVKKSVKSEQTDNLAIEIKDNDLCPRYLGVIIENVEIKESPEWLKKELTSMGYRAINNIVDITNFVMAEVGQPLHAFDKALINTDKNKDKTEIIIRRAQKGEKLLLLDGQEISLAEDMLVIANDKKPIALAGIHGGEESGVNKETKTIVLEAATFNAWSIRKTAQQLGLRTEASIRFEKWLDANLAETGMRRALKLIKEIMPTAQNKGNIVEDGEWQQPRLAVQVAPKFIQKRIGEKIKKEEMAAILTKLGFEAAVSGNNFNLQVPSWRATGDITIPEDIVEEVARIYGYDKLNEKEELVELKPPKYQREFEMEKIVKNYLVMSAKMHEVYNYPWAEASILETIGWMGKADKGMISLENPPAEGNKYLVMSLMPNLLKNILDNLRFFDEFKIFELARIFQNGKKKKYYGDDKLPAQPKMLGGAIVGEDEEVLLMAKGIVQGIFDLLMIETTFFNKEKLGIFAFFEKNKVLSLVGGKEEIAVIGLIDNNKFNLRNKKVAIFEINWEKALGMPSRDKKYEPLAVYPTVERDIAVEVLKNISWEKICGVITGIKEEEKVIKHIKFISEYPLMGKKSVAFRIICQGEKTLANEEIEALMGKIVNRLQAQLGAELRK